MGLLQSSRAWADIRRPRPWGNCDRCNFRYMLSELRWQYDWRGNELQNLRILVCRHCEDVPQPQLRPIIVGPDPYPVQDPRPGFAFGEMGPQPPVETPLEIIDGAGFPVTPTPSSLGLANDGGVLYLTDPTGYQTTSGGLPNGAVWNNGGAVAIVGGGTPSPSAPPVYFGRITASALRILSGINLPTTGPTPGSLQIWNNGGEAAVA